VLGFGGAEGGKECGDVGVEGGIGDGRGRAA